MREYTFHECRNEQREEGSLLFIEGTRTYQMSNRLAPIIEKLQHTYTITFPKAPSLQLGIIVTPRNGASGSWTTAGSATKGPIFLIELDPSVEHNEMIYAHEFAHPIIRLMGVFTGQSIGEIDAKIGNEFYSTSEHPFVFDLLESAGYGDEQKSGYISIAENEITKLSAADFSSPTYTQPPGQTWLALWYFNFYILARDKYNEIFDIHKKNASGVSEKMEQVVKCWLAATKNKGVLKSKAPVQGIRSFQSHLFNSLDLEGRVSRESHQYWEAWLFQQLKA